MSEISLDISEIRWIHFQHFDKTSKMIVGISDILRTYFHNFTNIQKILWTFPKLFGHISIFLEKSNIILEIPESVWAHFQNCTKLQKVFEYFHNYVDIFSF